MYFKANEFEISLNTTFLPSTVVIVTLPFLSTVTTTLFLSAGLVVFVFPVLGL